MANNITVASPALSIRSKEMRANQEAHVKFRVCMHARHAHHLGRLHAEQERELNLLVVAEHVPARGVNKV